MEDLKFAPKSAGVKLVWKNKMHAAFCKWLEALNTAKSTYLRVGSCIFRIALWLNWFDYLMVAFFSRKTKFITFLTTGSVEMGLATKACLATFFLS